MSQRRYNSPVVTGNFTGVTTGAVLNGATLHIGELQRQVCDLAARIVCTITMTNATIKPAWQGSNDGVTFETIWNDEVNTASPVVATGVANGTAQNGIPAPLGAYSYKYARIQLQWTSTTAGTTNDVVQMGYNFRLLDVGENQS